MVSAVGASFHEIRTPRFPLSDVRSKRRLPHLPQTVEGRVKIALLARDTWKSVDEEGLRFISANRDWSHPFNLVRCGRIEPQLCCLTLIQPQQGMR